MCPRLPMRTVCAVMWFACSGVGIWALTAYSFTPAAPTPVLEEWPAETALARRSNLHTAILFLQPRCPCSRASLMEATHLIEELGEKVEWVAVLQQPAPGTGDPVTTGITTLAGAIPGLSTYTDAGSVEAQRFGATISGELLLFDPHGRLCFHGGLTSGRGHEGVSVGSLAVRDWIRRGSATKVTCNVYGCRLYSAGEAPR